MKHQNINNHTRYVPLWHFITGAFIVSAWGGSIYNLMHIQEGQLIPAIILFLITSALLSIFWYARWFALRAQDRAIRAEENLRHYILTGKPLDKHLRTSQIVALRFASDEEFPGLAQKAADQKMRSQNIKKEIKNWRSDHHRV